MGKTAQTIRFLLRQNKKLLLWVGLVVVAVVAITDVIYFVTARYSSSTVPVVSLSVPFEMDSASISLIIGLVLFVVDFKIILANGVSRKTYFLAAVPVALIYALTVSLFNLIVWRIHYIFWPINFMSILLFQNIKWPGLLLLQASLYFAMLVFGCLISLAYYKCVNWMKYVISLLPIAVYVLLKLANALSHGATYQALYTYFSATTKTEYLTSLSFLAYAALAWGLIYLLVRRTPLKK